MKILLVEDDAAKANRIISHVGDIVGSNIDVARSYKSGLKALLSEVYELVILDMTLPNFDIGADEDGGRPLVFGGREILRQMKRRNKMFPVVVTTQFEQFGSGEEIVTRDVLDRELDLEYGSFYLGMVYYHATEERWKPHLSEKIYQIQSGLDA